MTTSWVRCDDLDVAAAFGTLGVPMSLKIQVRADNGREYVTAFLRPDSVTRPELKTAQLMKLLRSGELKKADPEHPLLYAIEGVKNRHAIADYCRNPDKRVILITRKGTKRTAYISEDSPKSTLGTVDRFLAGGEP